jgi:TFIIF-interacting CTD phosphatase-like protein
LPETSNQKPDFLEKLGFLPLKLIRLEPLKKVKRRGYNLESVIAIDDTPRKWEKSYGNLARVKPFEGDESDRELDHLLIYLDTLKNEKNIRSIEKRGWRDNIRK